MLYMGDESGRKLKSYSSKEADDHMRAGFRFNPRGFGRHGDALICDLEQGLDLWLSHKEDDLVLVCLALIDDSGHVFQLLE